MESKFICNLLYLDCRWLLFYCVWLKVFDEQMLHFRIGLESVF